MLPEAALIEALLDTESDVGGDGIAHSFDVLASDDLAEGGRDNIVAERKGLVGDLTSAKVLSVEGSDEGGRLAVWVVLGVDGADIEGGHHVGLELGADDASVAIGIEDAVLGHHLGDEATGGDDLELSGAGVDVKSVHAAGYHKER